MPTLERQISLDASADRVWDAIRDFGAVHTRVAPGFVVETQLDGDTRVVRFANGTRASERLVTSDDAARRLVYAIANERVSHYSAAVRVVPQGDGRCLLVWTIDFLPASIEKYVSGQMDDAARAMKPALEGR
jgi:hypothetical protein